MQRWRKLLLPFSWLYGAVVFVRNFLYDQKIFQSKNYGFPVLCIGNLSVGGTGKTPMTEYLAKLIVQHRRTAILSRGYKRSTKGFVLADAQATVRSLGDEPFQYHSKLKNVIVAVDEDRRHGIEQLKADQKVEVILLDDGYQHRRVQASCYILLTMYGDLYVDDLLLPAGNLRDLKSQSKRAQIVVVTKCPADLDMDTRELISERLGLIENQCLFFSSILYADVVIGHNVSKTLDVFKNKEVTLVTGIAQPDPLLQHLKSKGISFKHLKYPDHHNFSAKEIEYLKTQQPIITTEKDYVRLSGELQSLYYLPIRVEILDQKELFDQTILEFAKK